MSVIAEPATATEEVARPETNARRLWIPLGVYAASRVLVFLAMHVAAAAGRTNDAFLDIAIRWDGIHYLDLAKHGYPGDLTHVDGHIGSSLHAFFPLYPLTIRAVELVTPFGELGSGVLVALVAGAVATVLLWRLAARLFSPRVADGAVLVFCLFPGSFVLNWVYAEGLMLALVMASMFFLLRDRVLVAGLFGALATATRPNALALVLAFGWLALMCLLRRPREWQGAIRYAVGGAVASLGFVAYQVYLWALTGNVAAWFRVQRQGFGEGVNPGKETWETLFDLFPDDPREGSPMFTVVFVVLGLFLVFLVLRSRGLPGWMRIYSLGTMALALTANVAPASPRLQFAAFPAFIALAELVRGEARAMYLAASAMFLGILVIAYSNPVGPPFYMWAP